MPRCWARSSKRRMPLNRSRRTSTVHASPTSAAVRATEQRVLSSSLASTASTVATWVALGNAAPYAAFLVRTQRLVLAVTSLAVFLVFLDVTIVNIAFPAITDDFPGVSPAGLAWVVTA